MAVIFQYGEHAQFFKFLNFKFLNSAILQYGRQDGRFKYNLTFYNTATIFKI